MVLNGIDTIDNYDSLFRGKNLGLITSPSGVGRTLESTIDILSRKYRLKALYSPEHGVRGDRYAGATVDTYTDPYLHIPVYSLYRKDSKRMTPEMLKGIDLVVYDTQDIGTRFYTFIYTMLYAMESCAKAGVPFAVLDRPNPLGGTAVEGNIIGEEYRSFVGAYPICIRYGLTAGELARMANGRFGIGCDLHVVPCRGWSRRMLFPETGRLWVMPTPAIPRFESALLYPGMCLLEGTNLSEGRGTAAPFELAGAPFIKAVPLAAEMNRLRLPGVLFRPAYFVPYTDKFSGELCEGVQIHITDAHAVRSVETGLYFIDTVRRLYGDQFQFLPVRPGQTLRPIDRLTGDRSFRENPGNLDGLLAAFRKDAALFAEQKQEYHLYAE